MRKIAALAVTAAVALPGAAFADGPASDSTSPARSCKEQRTAIGAAAFRDLYGTNRNKSNAFGKCVSRQTRSQDAALQEARQNAPAACREERDRDPAAFAAKYGTNRGKTNAFGKCVSQTAKAESQETIEANDDATINAAKACKAERRADPDAFAQRYGTNANKRNAFGKCVSQQVKRQQSDDGGTTS
jgi:opacity protein-like surface antigen